MYRFLWLIALSLILSCSSEKAPVVVQKAPADKTIKADEVQTKSEQEGEEIPSNTVKTGNTPPELTSVKIMPEVFKPGDTLYIEASASDLDEDEVTILYEWTKNGEPAGNDKKIGVPIKRGDRISVRITPFDGEVHGNPITMRREISNLPPMIIENKEFSFDGKVYTYQTKAEDPDEDTLTYSLKSGPEGMTINPSTGLVQWDVPLNFKGKVSYTISANDGNGGESLYNLDTTVGFERR